MKKVFILLVSLLAMTAASTGLKAQEVSILLGPEWNWIGYPYPESVDIDAAFGDFEPMPGDLIESLFGYSEYLEGYGWLGAINELRPGWGYMYYSNRTEAVNVVLHAPASQTAVTTAEPTDITATSAVVGGTVTVPEGTHVFLRGVCWGAAPSPDIDGDHTSEEPSLGNYSSTIENLTPNTTYYVRAYVVSDSGLSYGNEESFTTLPIWVIDAIPNPIDGGIVTGNGEYEENAICTLTAVPNEGFIFTNWTENGEVVSTEAGYTFMASGDRSLVANFRIPIHIGAIDGKFSVNNNGDQVCFSQGNLQYRASTNTWRFAENQFDYIGEANSNVAQSYGGWIDLFGWGTSGYNHGAVCYQPWSTSENNSDYYAYGSSYNNLNNQTGQADWGYNAISNGGNQTDQWRTLTKEEWKFLFNTRSTSSGIRFARAKVNNVNGVILLPDDWSSACYTLNNTNNTNASFSSNIITLSSWNVLEANGAVFLPTAGFRDGTFVYGGGTYGGYHTATYLNSDGVYDLYIGSSYLLVEGTCPRSNAQSVRLVCSVPTYTIDASVIPSDGGTVTGTGNYAKGQFCTLTAIASSGYTFVSWKENGEVVSTEASYSFTVTGDRSLVANFEVDECAVVFDLHDSYGDGWNGNKLVVTYGDGNYEEITLGSGSSGSQTLWMENGSHATLTWIVGNWTNECSFTVSYSSGIVIYNGSNLSGSFSYEFNVDCNSVNIIAEANPTEGGNISGAGIYGYGTTCVLTAIPYEGYVFTNWTENGEVVDIEATYSFTVNGNRNLVANFTVHSDDYGYVDLGLPSGLLWATCNVGADTPEDYGDYFAWGETQSKNTYSWSNYQYCNGSENTLIKYCSNSSYGYNGFTDNLTTLLPEDDAASVNWGAAWRMPTKEEWQELYQNTTHTFTVRNGVCGRLFLASNGNSFFLPAAGRCNGSSLNNVGSEGSYWSSSLNINNPNFVSVFYFGSGAYGISGYDRYGGLSIRPVRSASQN